MEQPAKLKHYEILSRLGEGGMGVVFRARDTRLGRLVALKMLPEGLACDEERSQRFEREARIVSAISHPGIATLYDIDRDGETSFITMELVEGSNLRQLLDAGPLGKTRLMDCAVQIAEALAAAHREGVIHRDLKPENIMAAESGYFKVLDFGVARMEQILTAGPEGEPESRPTQTPTKTWTTRDGALLGTVAYMSPEQALGEPIDARSDIFSFGSLLYELATGRPAFRGRNEIAVAQAITSGRPESMRRLRPELPDGLELVVEKCLEKRPEDRYQTADLLAEDLRRVRIDSLSGARSTGGLLAAASPRRPLRLPLIAAGAALLAIAGYLVLRGPGPPAPGLGPPPQRARELPAAHEAGRPRVIVAFFENASDDPDAESLTRGLPEMLTTDLSGSAGLEVIATQRLYDLLAMAGRGAGEALDRSTAAELARWAGANLVITGSVVRLGEQYRIDAQAYDVETGAVRVAHKVEGTELLEMVDELTAALRDGLQVASEKTGRMRAVTTSSPEAYQLFVRGKRHYDQLRFEEAARDFREALDLDPGFELARVRLAMTLQQEGEKEQALELIDESLPRADRLPEPERLLTLGINAYFNLRDQETGERYLTDLINRFPRDKEAYVVWARALSELEREPFEATRKLRRAIEQDPNNLLAIKALASQLASFGERDEARRMLSEAMERNPDARPPLSRLIESYDEP